MRIQIPVCLLEFDTDSHTIWVQSPVGATVLRIKTMSGKITTNPTCENVVSHMDLLVEGNMEFCLAADAVVDGEPR